MIVIGVDVHKHSLTAVAVDELGRVLAEHSGPVDAACSFGRARLTASGCGRSRTAGMSPAALEQLLLERVSGWCGCRPG